MPEPRRENLSIQVDGGKCRFEQDLIQNISRTTCQRGRRGESKNNPLGASHVASLDIGQMKLHLGGKSTLVGEN